MFVRLGFLVAGRWKPKNISTQRKASQRAPHSLPKLPRCVTAASPMLLSALYLLLPSPSPLYSHILGTHNTHSTYTQAVAKGELKLIPEDPHKTTWNFWLDNIRPWYAIYTALPAEGTPTPCTRFPKNLCIIPTCCPTQFPALGRVP